VADSVRSHSATLCYCNVIRDISSYKIEENLESCIYAANYFWVRNTQTAAECWFTIDFYVR